MMTALNVILSVALMLVGIVFAAIFPRALSARLMTGEWPHQSEQSKRIYEKLP